MAPLEGDSRPEAHQLYSFRNPVAVLGGPHP
jgi:hypothetical protein